MSIQIVPVGDIDPAVLNMLQQELGRVFNQEVPVGRSMSLPTDAFNPRRNQYAAEIVLHTVSEHTRPTGSDRTVAVVDADLYVQSLNFVFGLAGGRTALFSLHRLRQSFYNLPENPVIFYRRVLTEAIHELGHTYGLEHSSDSSSVMFFSNSIEDTDRKGPEFNKAEKERLIQLGAIRQ